MPAADYVVPMGLTDRILTHLAAHPDDGFRVADMSRVIYPETENRSAATVEVGSALSRLRRKGLILRVQRSVPGRVAPITTYHHLPS